MFYGKFITVELVWIAVGNFVASAGKFEVHNGGFVLAYHKQVNHALKHNVVSKTFVLGKLVVGGVQHKWNFVVHFASCQNCFELWILQRLVDKVYVQLVCILLFQFATFHKLFDCFVDLLHVCIVVHKLVNCVVGCANFVFVVLNKHRRCVAFLIIEILFVQCGTYNFCGH